MKSAVSVGLLVVLLVSVSGHPTAEKDRLAKRNALPLQCPSCLRCPDGTLYASIVAQVLAAIRVKLPQYDITVTAAADVCLAVTVFPPLELLVDVPVCLGLRVKCCPLHGLPLPLPDLSPDLPVDAHGCVDLSISCNALVFLYTGDLTSFPLLSGVCTTPFGTIDPLVGKP
jgi:hypothetical protein